MGNQDKTFEQFLNEGHINLSEKEMCSYKDWKNENVAGRSSWLGWIFVKLFKAPLQKKYFGNKSNIISTSETPKPDQKEKKDEPCKFPEFVKDRVKFDELSNYYGNLYRGSFVFNYFLGAIAVFAALVPVGFNFEELFGEHEAHQYSLIAAGVELVIILSILLIYKIGATPLEKDKRSDMFGHRWHEKWLEYRLLAERFRYMEILYPIGIDPLDDLTKQHLHGQGWNWMDAYFAYCVSEVKSSRSDDLVVYKEALNSRDDLNAYKKSLNKIMVGQAKYHEGNVGKMERIHHRLHTFASWLFFATLLACLAHFAVHLMILTLLAGFLPALAAAMHGILATGEFSKTASISERMEEQINDLIKDLSESNRVEDVHTVVRDFHDIVIKDVMGWKAIFIDKNVPLA